MKFKTVPFWYNLLQCINNKMAKINYRDKMLPEAQDSYDLCIICCGTIHFLLKKISLTEMETRTKTREWQKAIILLEF